MDKAEFFENISRGLSVLNLSADVSTLEGLWRYQEELLKWNAKVNLTAITAPAEVVEKHFVDSLAALPEVGGAKSLLDLGAGAGLPGIPLALALPELSVTLVDAVEKKVTFMKVALAALGLAPRGKALHRRAEGNPTAEGIPLAEVVVSRAFRDLPDWLPLAKQYVAPGGRVVAMLGKAQDVESTVTQHGGKLISLRSYELPWSRAERSVAVISWADGS